MATIIFGGGITRAVGSHAGTTFAANKGGAYMKAKVKGVNPRSELQLARRTSLGQLSKYYTNTLTDAQRTAWATFASTYPVVNRVGNTSYLSGQQMFTKLNAQVLNTGGAIVATPPASTAVGTPTACTLTPVHGGGGSLGVSNTIAAPTANDKVLIWCSPPLNPGVSFVSSLLRRLPVLLTVNTGTSLTTPYTDVFGIFPSGPGQRVIARIQVVNDATGITSSMLQATAIWS